MTHDTFRILPVLALVCQSGGCRQVNLAVQGDQAGAKAGKDGLY